MELRDIETVLYPIDPVTGKRIAVESDFISHVMSKSLATAMIQAIAIGDINPLFLKSRKSISIDELSKSIDDGDAAFISKRKIDFIDSRYNSVGSFLTTTTVLDMNTYFLVETETYNLQ